MPRQSTIPAYRRHKKSGQAIVTLPDGLGGRRDFLLGEFESADSKSKYHRLVSEWEANGRRVQVQQAQQVITLNQLILAYWKFANKYYQKGGQITSEVYAIKQAVRFVKNAYGELTVSQFTPLKLKAVREKMIVHKITRTYLVNDPETGEKVKKEKVLNVGLTRKNINKHVQRIRRMFSWGVEEELVPVAVQQALLCVKGLRKGKTEARETPRVKPVADDIVDATLPRLQPLVADMVRVQRLTGMRPHEICELRSSEIDMTGAVWEFRPARFKTEHHEDRERVVFLGRRRRQSWRNTCRLPRNRMATSFPRRHPSMPEMKLEGRHAKAP